MESPNDDPLLQKLRALKTPPLDPTRRTKTLRAAEKAFSGEKRPAWRLPEMGLAAVLALSAVLYTAESMIKVGRIYGRTEVAASDSAR